MATNRLTPGREGYKILFNDNMVIMNYKFAAAAAKYGTKENKLMEEITVVACVRKPPQRLSRKSTPAK